MTYREKISKLQLDMKNQHVDMTLIFCTDHHIGEFIAPHHEQVQFLTGFTGYVGDVIVTQTEICLFTDVRYEAQATIELKDSGVKVFTEAPSVAWASYIELHLSEGQTLGFDGRYSSANQGLQIESIVARKKANLQYDFCGVEAIWTDRPELPKRAVYILPQDYVGESATDKLSTLRQTMQQQQMDTHLLAETDAIAWLLNLRGDDIPNMNQYYSFLMLTQTQCILYIDSVQCTDAVLVYLQSLGVTTKEYTAIYEDICHEHHVVCDMNRLNYLLYRNFTKRDEACIVHQISPVMLMKLVKNPVELDGLRQAGIKDSVAIAKWMYWLTQIADLTQYSEFTITNQLEQFRQEQDGYIQPSFSEVCAYAENAALVFYHQTSERAKVLENKGMLLVDSGGGYIHGSTDITRTIPLGALTEDMKHHYTMVLTSYFALATTHFPEGLKGSHLDVIARRPMWDSYLDYSTRTGHGLGNLLNVHEGPIDFKWQNEACPALAEHMVMTIEPGVYIDGQYGIRLENDVIIAKDRRGNMAQFLSFEVVTFVPFAVEALALDKFPTEYQNALDQYHADVFEKISPYLNDAEKSWLTDVTKPIATVQSK